MSNMDRLTIAVLAVRGGASEAKVAELVRLGLIAGEGDAFSARSYRVSGWSGEG